MTKNSRLYLPLALLFSLLFSFSGNAQDYAFRSWSISEGLSQSQVWTMLEDSRGYIWMGTRGGGLCRFDGSEFKAFTNQQGLANNYILSLCETQDGTLWVGTNDGLSHYNGLRFETLELPGPEAIAVYSLTETPDGVLWIGTDAGLFRFDGEEIIDYSEEWQPLQVAITCLFTDSKKQLWVGSNNGLHLVSKDEIVSFGTNQGMTSRRIRSIAEDKAGNLWVGTYDAGVNIYDGHGFTYVNSDLGVKNGLINSVYSDREGTIWLATLEDGAARWNETTKQFTYLNESDGLCNNHVRKVLQDSWGNYWFGTSGGGVSKYYRQRFGHYGESIGLPGDYIYSVFFDRAGNLWTGTSGRGITRRDSSGFTTFRKAEGFVDEKVKAITQDCWGRIWCGTEGEGLGIYEDGRFTLLSGNDGLSDTWVKDILQTSDSSVWVATAGWGITRMIPLDSIGDGFSFEYYNKSNLLPVKRVTCLHEDKKGRLWFGTSGGGVGCLTGFNQPGESVKAFFFNESNGLADNIVRDLTEDKNGNLWIATQGNALNRISIYEDEPKVEHFDHTSGLTSTNIYALVADQDQRLWIGTEAGLDRVELDDAGNVLRVRHFGQAEEMRGIELASRAITIGPDQKVWMGTIGSLESFDPKLNQRNETPPRLSITGISLTYQDLAATDYGSALGDWFGIEEEINFAYNDNHLTFDFIGIDHRNPSRVSYRWRLSPDEEDWSPITNRHSAIYSNIAPGDYVFEVQTANEDMVWSESLTISFSIAIPFWQTWWFYTLIAVVAISLVGLIFYFRIRKIRNEAESEREKLELEKDLVKLEQKALRLQMNPHFIFNALNSIQGLIANQDAKTARYYLAKFSRLMRLILENSRTPIINLEDEITTLENYLSLEQFSSGEHFDFEITVAESLDRESTGVPPMMIQPFIENAIIHGVRPLGHSGGKISIHFFQEGEHLICTITDNGIGREKAAQSTAQKANYHKSTALAVTQERLDILNGGSEHEKGLEIEDLKHEDGTAAGTKVTLRIPVLSVVD